MTERYDHTDIEIVLKTGEVVSGSIIQFCGSILLCTLEGYGVCEVDRAHMLILQDSQDDVPIEFYSTNDVYEQVHDGIQAQTS